MRRRNASLANETDPQQSTTHVRKLIKFKNHKEPYNNNEISFVPHFNDNNINNKLDDNSVTNGIDKSDGAGAATNLNETGNKFAYETINNNKNDGEMDVNSSENSVHIQTSTETTLEHSSTEFSSSSSDVTTDLITSTSESFSNFNKHKSKTLSSKKQQKHSSENSMLVDKNEGNNNNVNSAISKEIKNVDVISSTQQSIIEKTSISSKEINTLENNNEEISTNSISNKINIVDGSKNSKNILTNKETIANDYEVKRFITEYLENIKNNITIKKSWGKWRPWSECSR